MKKVNPALCVSDDQSGVPLPAFDTVPGSSCSSPCSILHLEDNRDDAELIRDTLRTEGVSCCLIQVKDRKEFVAALERRNFDLILADQSLPSFNGTAALQLARSTCPEVPFIFLSGTMDEARAAQSLHDGASDYVPKEELSRLAPTIRRAIEVVHERNERRRAEAERDRFFTLSVDLLCVLGFDGRLKRLNPSWEKALGFSMANFQSKPLLGFVHPQDRAATAGHFEKLIRKNQPVHFESRFRRRDGSCLWLQWNAIPLAEEQVIYASARDITGIKNAQAALRQSEKYFRSLIENASDIISVLNADSTFRYQSPSVVRILGYQPGEMTGTNALDYLHPEDRPRIAAILRQTLPRVGRIERVEFRFRHKEGAWRVLEAIGRVWEDASGAPCVIVNSRDITERNQSADALRLSEARIRAVVESSLDGVITMDQEGRVVDFNPAAEKIFGYPRHKVPGQPLASLIIPAELREEYQRGFEEHLETGESQLVGRRIETIAMRKDGTEFPIELAISRIACPGAPHFTACLRDITDRKRAETEIQKLAAFPRLNPSAVFEFANDGSLSYFNDAALDIAKALGENHPSRLLPPDTVAIVRNCLTLGQSKLRYETQIGRRTLSWAFYPIIASGVVHCYACDITERKHSEEQIREQAALLDKAQDAILVRDLEHRIVYWNKSAERIFGWTAEEVAGRNALELISQKEGPEFLDALKAVLDTGEWNGELRQATKSGAEVILESRWTLVRNDQGQPKSILVLSTDISEKKQLEAQFLRAQRLESIGTLASGIAHDLNNILAPIMMSVDLLQETLVDQSHARLLETLRSSAQRGAEMVKQILSFTRGQDGGRALINLKHLVSEVSKIVRETFPKNIQVTTVNARDLWPILADTTQVHQILMNLCVNARDAMADGGALTIQTENLLIAPQGNDHATKPGSYVVLTVADTGTGIPPEIREKIWSPFFTMKPQGKGTGLGLSTVLTIVKAHEGFIQTESEMGKGTCFRIFLPAAEATTKVAAPHETAAPPTGRGERILVIDDERAFQEITRAIFVKYGYRVITASDGTEAVALFAQHRDDIALVMTDMVMPFLDGPATIDALRRLDPSIPIIAASGLNESEKFVESLADATFLLKPFTTENLLTAVNQALRSRHKLSA
jgi:PAS domain S-box-containing protein